MTPRPGFDANAQFFVFELILLRRSITMRTRLVSLILFTLILTFFSTSTTAWAFEDEPDDYDVKARVVRISLISGEVTLKRSGNTEWERARLNFPLVEGDTIATDREG